MLVVYGLSERPQAFYLLALQELRGGDPNWLVISNSNQMLVEIIKAEI